MPRSLALASVTGLLAGPAAAGGLDRSGQPVDLLFEPGNRATLALGATRPALSGTGLGLGVAFPSGTAYDEVGEGFLTLSGGVKVALTDRLSAALLFEQPFGADVAYPGDPARSELGGTFAEARTDSVTALLRYRTDARLSLHGGLRLQQASGEIGLSGLAYGPFSGYRVELDPDWAAGYVLGVAYEIPEIAFRMALTYNSAITHAFETVETGNANPALDGASTTEVDTPRSVNLDIQSGIAEDTLLFGGLRWAEWSAFRIDPEGFSSPVAVGGSGEGLVDLEDTTTWEIGLARRFGPRFGASVAILHEAPGDTLVSPLAPSTGASAIQFGGAWTEGDVTLTGGLRYTWLGDAEAETGTPDTARASFEDNSSLSVGLGLGFAF